MANTDLYWFKHDGNARRDQKILTMRLVYGAEGYGWFWMLIEIMREASGHKIKLSGKYDLAALAKELDANPARLQEFIDDCCNEFGLFQRDEGFFWSPSLLRRIAAYDELLGKRRQAAKVRWDKEQKEQQKEPEPLY